MSLHITFLVDQVIKLYIKIFKIKNRGLKFFVDFVSITCHSSVEEISFCMFANDNEFE